MAEDDRTLRSLYAVRGDEPAEAHLNEDDWLGLASGGIAVVERAHAIEHVVRCRPCAHIYRGLSELEDGARRFDQQAPQAIGPAPLDVLQTTRWGWWGGLAAAATLVWAIAQPRPAVAPAPEPSGSELRGPAAARPVLVEPLGTLARWPTQLRWEPVMQSRGYRVRILNGDADLLWASAIVTETSVAWPAQVGPRSGRTYWQVTAYPQGSGDADGVASVLASFDYTPRP